MCRPQKPTPLERLVSLCDSYKHHRNRKEAFFKSFAMPGLIKINLEFDYHSPIENKINTCSIQLEDEEIQKIYAVLRENSDRKLKELEEEIMNMKAL